MNTTQKEQLRQFTWWTYVLLCFVGTVVVIFKKGDAVIFALGDWTDTISDPVLQPALKLLLIALGVVLLPGIIAILLAFGAFLIAFVIIPVLLFQGVAWLASVSPPTAVLAVLALSAGIATVMYNNRVAIRKAWVRVRDVTLEALAWGIIIFRAGATESLREAVPVVGAISPVEEEATGVTMDEETRSFEDKLATFERKYPETAPLPAALTATGFESWLSELKKSLEIKLWKRTQAERVEAMNQLVTLQSQYYSLKKTNLDIQILPREHEIRQKKLDLEEAEINVKIAEAKETTIRSKKLDLEEAEISLRKEQIKEERRKIKEQTKRASRPPDTQHQDERQFAALAANDERCDRMHARCKGDKEREKQVEQIREHRRMEILSGKY